MFGKILNLFAALVVTLAVAFLFGNVALAGEEMVLYVQEGCSHCAKVESFIEEHKLGDQVMVKDTLVDDGADEEYTTFLEEQGISAEEAGVPMLVYDGDKYEFGDTPIIDVLKEKYDISDEESKSGLGDYAILIGGSAVILAVAGYGIFNVVNGKSKS